MQKPRGSKPLPAVHAGLPYFVQHTVKRQYIAPSDTPESRRRSRHVCISRQSDDDLPVVLFVWLPPSLWLHAESLAPFFLEIQACRPENLLIGARNKCHGE